MYALSRWFTRELLLRSRSRNLPQSSAATGPRSPFRALRQKQVISPLLQLADDFRPGTLGFSDHGIQPRATRPTSSTDPTAAQPDLTEPVTRRVTRSMSTSISTPPPISAVAIVQDYHSLYAEMSWEPPSDVSHFACLLAKRVARTEDNPTFNSARSGPEWESWKPAVDAEMKLLSPEDLHCYEPVLRQDIPRGHQILQGKMDLKTS